MQDLVHLRPTPEHYQAFGDYLCEAHSWYKHLSLLNGRRFVVFVAPDAGIGRLVARLHGASPETATSLSLVTPPEGPEFTDANPRLHYGWKTTREYRSRFGYLDYMYRLESAAPYNRDAGPPVPLPAQVEERCGFVLYPYVSWTFREAVTWSVHADAIARLRAGTAHPARNEVLELARLAKLREDAGSALTEAEHLLVISHESFFKTPLPAEQSVELRKYLELGNHLDAVCGALRAKEVDKIQRALAELDDWLSHG